MAEDKVFMDTGVFTGIVNDIKSAGEGLVFSEEPQANLSALETLSVGREIIETLEQVYKNTDVYRLEVSQSLPKGLLTLRDSMINVDKAVSESLSVERRRE
ncbi:MAG: hypothetical protein J5802_10355 [Butyrivibrio sp.]|nr:hypothetical protein [Butyrivibrio sp.]